MSATSSRSSKPTRELTQWRLLCARRSSTSRRPPRGVRVPPREVPPLRLEADGLRERDGELPAVGTVLDEEEGRMLVTRIGPSPLPGDDRRCAYLQAA